MTGPIKPPSGTNVPPPDVSLEKTSGTDGARFREALEAQSSAEVRGAEQVGDPVLAALREGRIDGPGAVDALVARALSSDVAKGLTPAGRVALEQHLRAQLADDPALARLVRDLG